ncbi:MAG: hypothetical protein J6Y07_00640 [Alphaproteobacteria bacterium]|nr:hypothetical protein [Alphaproteobacteria bacterium]
MRKFMVFGLFAAFIGFAFADDIADRQTVTSLTYVNDELSTRQDKIGAQSGTQVATFTNTAGEITPREVKSDLGNNTNDTALPTVSAVNDGLNATQDTLGANKHADYVATYTSALGELGEKGIYQDSGTYATQQNTLVDAETFNAALQNGLDNEFVCANRPDAYDPVTGNCWLWEIHNETENNTILPSGYTPLEYIRSTGTQYIDTGVSVKRDTLAEFEYQFTNVNNENFVFGQVAGSARRILGFRSSRIWWFVINDGLNFADTLKHRVVFGKDGKVYRDGELVTAKRGNFATPAQSETILVFAQRTDNNTVNKGKVKIYHFMLKEGDTVVQNLIPARRNSDNVLGMYDTMTGTFFTNSGTGTFIAGPEVSNNIYLPQNQ